MSRIVATRKNGGASPRRPKAEKEAHPAAAARARGDKPIGGAPRAVRGGATRAQRGVDKALTVDPPSESAGIVGAAAQDIGSFIRTQREAAEVSIRQLADRAGVSNPYLSQIERGLRKPSAEVLSQIAKALRMSAEVLYAQAGILELREGSEVRDAILAAPELTERQREVLVEIYESFRLNNTAPIRT